MQFKNEWLREPKFKDWLERKDGVAYCHVCETQIIGLRNAYTLERHARGKKHLENMRLHESPEQSDDDDYNTKMQDTLDDDNSTKKQDTSDDDNSTKKHATLDDYYKKKKQRILDEYYSKKKKRKISDDHSSTGKQVILDDSTAKKMGGNSSAGPGKSKNLQKGYKRIITLDSTTDKTFNSKTDKSLTSCNLTPKVSLNKLEEAQREVSDDDNASLSQLSSHVDIRDLDYEDSSDADDIKSISTEEETASISSVYADNRSGTSPTPSEANMDATLNTQLFRCPRECQKSPKERLKKLQRTARTSHVSEDILFQEIISTVQSWPPKLRAQAKRNMCNAVFDLALESLGET